MASPTRGAVSAGLRLSFWNAVAICVLLAGAISPGGYAPAIFMVLMVCALPVAIPAGALIGYVAGRVVERRLLVLTVASLALVPLCGVIVFAILGEGRMVDEFEVLVVLASIPTFLFTMRLERVTRPPPPEAQPLPVAYVR